MSNNINGFFNNLTSNLKNLINKAGERVQEIYEKADAADGVIDGKVSTEFLFKVAEDFDINIDEDIASEEYLQALTSFNEMTGGKYEITDSSDSSLSDQDKQNIANAFAFDGDNTMADSKNLQYGGVITKPISYTFDIPTEGKAKSSVSGKGDYGTGRTDDYKATYDKNGKLSQIIAQNEKFGDTVISYNYNDNGEITETKINKHIGSKTINVYNADGTIKSTEEYLSDEYGDDVDEKDMDYKLQNREKYKYSVDKDGNPVQTMTNSHNVTIETTLKPDGVYEQKNLKLNTTTTYKASVVEKNPEINNAKDNAISNAFGKDSDYRSKLWFAMREVPSSAELPYANTIYNNTFKSWNDNLLNGEPNSTATGKYDYNLENAPGVMGGGISEATYVAEYDDKGRLIKINTKDYNGQALENCEYNYASNGEKTETYKSYKGTRITVFNEDGTVKSYKEYDSQGVLQKSNEYTYEIDSKGNAVQITKNNSGQIIATTMDNKGEYSQLLVQDSKNSPERASNGASLFKNEKGTYIQNDSILGSRNYYDENGNGTSYIFSIYDLEGGLGRDGWEGTFNGTTTNGNTVYGKLVVNNTLTGEGTLDGKDIIFDKVTGKITFKNEDDEKNARPAFENTLHSTLRTYKDSDGNEINVIKKTEVNSFDEKDTNGYNFYDAHGRNIAHLIMPTSDSGKGYYFGYDSDNKWTTGEITKVDSKNNTFKLNGKDCKINPVTGQLTYITEPSNDKPEKPGKPQDEPSQQEDTPPTQPQIQGFPSPEQPPQNGDRPSMPPQIQGFPSPQGPGFPPPPRPGFPPFMPPQGQGFPFPQGPGFPPPMQPGQFPPPPPMGPIPWIQNGSQQPQINITINNNNNTYNTYNNTYNYGNGEQGEFIWEYLPIKAGQQETPNAPKEFFGFDAEGNTVQGILKYNPDTDEYTLNGIKCELLDENTVNFIDTE